MFTYGVPYTAQLTSELNNFLVSEIIIRVIGIFNASVTFVNLKLYIRIINQKFFLLFLTWSKNFKLS